MNVLIDSSAWIESFRQAGDRRITEVVAGLVSQGEAAIVGMVKLELLRGIREHELKRFERYLTALSPLPTREIHYEEAGRLGAALRAAGETVPSSDLLIATLAMSYRVPLLHCDRHFDRIADLTDLQIYPC